MRYVAGVDLGGTNTKIGIVSNDGEIVESLSIKTLSHEGIEETFGRIWETIQNLENKHGVKVDSIGMGIPGPVLNESVVKFFANFPWAPGVDCAALLKSISGLPVKLGNDVNVIALGEATYGAGRDFQSSVTIALGTGIGGGIFVNGKLISGISGAGGEIGHMTLVKGGNLCGCGQKGCFETYASATAIIREARSRLTINKDNKLYELIDGNLDILEAKHVFDAVKLGDAFAIDIFDWFTGYLAMGIANIMNIINPEAIVIAGGVALSGDLILPEVKEKIKEMALPITIDDTNFFIAELGNDGGILGAAALVKE